MTQSRRTAADMFPLIDAYLGGEHTQKQFCHEHDISLAVLNYWIASYRRQHAQKTTSFVDITPVSTPQELPLMEVVFPHGTRLRLFAPVDPDYLNRLLALGRAAR